MKPLTFTALFLAFAGLLSCGAKESKGQDSAADAIKNFQTPADAASDAAVEEAAPAGSEAAPASRKKLRISDAWCEHQLWNQAGNNYHPRKMTDGNPATAWAAKLDLVEDYFQNGLIIGPVFDLASPSRISGVELQNGYCKNSSSFKNNTRATWVRIYRYHPEFDGEYAEDQMMGEINDEDIIYEGPLEDSMSPQFFPVSAGFDNSQPTRAVGLIFRYDRMHRGAKWNDLCLSEIKIFGR